MTSLHCLAGIQCPNCGNTSRFHIEATLTVDLPDDEGAVSGDLYWDWLHHTYCATCGYQALLAAFRNDEEAQP